MSAATAEATPIATEIPDEQYARSLHEFRVIGEQVLKGLVDIDMLPEMQKARANNTSALCEMLRTDGEFNRRFDIDGQRRFQLINGQACDIDTRPLVAMVRGGSEKSAKLAQSEPRFRFQAIRDRGDVYLAQEADDLEEGESLFAVLMDPKEGLEKYPEIYQDELGYRKGLLYIQRYSKENGQMVAGYCSVDMSDEAIWRDILAEEGVSIPEGESPDTWVMHAFKRKMNSEQAEDYILGLRDRYYERAGVRQKRYSVSEYIANNQHVVDTYFNAYLPSLAKAIYTGENNATLQGLAQELLKADLRNMKASAKMQLRQVAGSAAFNDELGKAMEVIIRYGVAEELRRGLKAVVQGTVPESYRTQEITTQDSTTAFVPPPELLSQRLAQNVENGVQAGRSYGGCPGQISLNKMESQNGEGVPGSLQQPYGGRSESGYSKRDRINCINCHKQVTVGEVEQEDSEGKVKSWKCPHCKHEVDICTGTVEHQGARPEEVRRQRLADALAEEAAQRAEKAIQEVDAAIPRHLPKAA